MNNNKYSVYFVFRQLCFSTRQDSTCRRKKFKIENVNKPSYLYEIENFNGNMII